MQIIDAISCRELKITIDNFFIWQMLLKNRNKQSFIAIIEYRFSKSIHFVTNYINTAK